MKKILEDYLWSYLPDQDQIRKQLDNGSRKWAVDVIEDMVRLGWIQSPKQAYRTLEKWNDKGLIDWGTSIKCCWKIKHTITDEK